MYSEFTTTRVLTMEWVDGERLRTASDSVGGATVDKRGSIEDLQLVEIGVRCSLEQVTGAGGRGERGEARVGLMVWFTVRGTPPGRIEHFLKASVCGLGTL